MKSEIAFQPEDLSSIRLFRPGRKCLFVGSGDSYAAGLAAQHASANRCRCCNPLDLVRDPSIAEGRVVYLVSISGRTKENVHAAKASVSQGLSTVAVTTKPDSPLARECDRAIRLKYRIAPSCTAGTVSFSASVMTCLSLATRVEIPKRLDLLLGRAKRQALAAAARMRFADGSYFVLGHGVLFPIALYAALKFNEVLGAKASVYHTEEFCHSPIFSARRNDAIIILGFDNDPVSCELAKRLDSDGFRFTKYIRVSKSEIAGGILHSTFFVQMLVLLLAETRGIKECYFLRDKRLLRISSDLIYG